MKTLKIFCASDYKWGSSPGALFDYAEKLGHNCGYDSRNFKQDLKGAPDVVIISNIRNLKRAGKIVINVQHGNLFQGSTQPEPYVNLVLVASASEKNMVVCNGYHPDNVIVAGHPRSDELFNYNDQVREKYLIDKGLDPNKSTILYAPTYSRYAFGCGNKLFFGNSASVKEDQEMAQVLVETTRSRNLIIRLHRYLKREYGPKLIPDYLQDILKNVVITDSDSDPNPNPVLYSSDLMITDFSSIAAGFMVLDRPVVFIEPHVGWKYTEKWHCPKTYRYNIGNVIKNKQEFRRLLNKTIKDIQESTSEGRKIAIEKYNPYFDGRCCERAWNGILKRLNG